MGLLPRRIDAHEHLRIHDSNYLRRGAPKRDTKLLLRSLLHLQPHHGRVLLQVHQDSMLVFVGDGCLVTTVAYDDFLEDIFF